MQGLINADIKRVTVDRIPKDILQPIGIFFVVVNIFLFHFLP